MAAPSGSSSAEATARFLERLAGSEPPAAGPAIACCLALAAGLAELTAAVAGKTELAARARSRRALPAQLARADAEAYAAYLRSGGETGRERTIELPLEMAELAAEIAELAARAAEGVERPVRGDAVTGALLAEAAARAAELLVGINAPPEDERLEEAARHRERAAAAAARATTTGYSPTET